MNTLKIIMTFMLALTASFFSGASTPQNSDYIHFSFPITSTVSIKNAEQPAIESSKTFWKEVTGKQLKEGVALQNSGAQPLVLLSHHAGSNSEQRIDVKKLLLTDQNGKSIKGQMVSEKALRETGFFARSVAVMVEDVTFKGPMKLQSTQNFDDKQLFIMTVKDKNSPVSLDVYAPHQQVKVNQAYLAKVSLNLFSQRKLALAKHDAKVNAILHAPDGKRIQLEVDTGVQEITIKSPVLDNALSPRQGLYDIEVVLNANVGGQLLQRNAKVAVAMSKPTGKLSEYTMIADEPAMASVSFLAVEPARYEVRAVLYGQDKNGNKVAIMEGHAAQTFNSGTADIMIPFDLSKLQQQNISGPYEIGNVRLYDQDQLALLDESNKRANVTQAVTF